MKIISSFESDLNYLIPDPRLKEDVTIIESKNMFNSFFEVQQNNFGTLNLKLNGVGGGTSGHIFHNKVLVLNVPFPFNYGHILHDVLPKLIACDNDSTWDIIYTAKWDLLEKIINLLSISFKKIQLVQTGHTFSAKTVQVENHFAYHKRDGEKVKKLKTIVEEFFLKQEESVASPVVVYYSRSNNPFVQHQRIMDSDNESEIIELLKEFSNKNNLNFIVYNGLNDTGEKMSIEDQMSLFRKAKVVVGPHGSGLANAIWLNPKLNPYFCEFTSGTQKVVYGGIFDKSYYMLYGRFLDEIINCYLIPFTEDSTQNITKVDIEDVKKFLKEVI